MTWPCVVLWGLILLGTLSRGPLMIYLYSATGIFGSLTMLPPGLTANLNLPAQLVCAGILILKIFRSSDNLAVALRLAFDVRKLGLLSIFSVYAAFTALFFPKLLAGSIMLFPLNNAFLQPLQPTSSNIAQTVYLSFSVLILFAFTAVGRHGAFRTHYLRAVLLTSVLLIASGLIDLAFSSAGRSDFLMPFHNASYALLTDVDLGGQKRVVGFMPEASAYGSTCCIFTAFLVFCQNSFEPQLRRLLVPITSAGLAIMTFLSTSSTGYAGLAVVAGVMFVQAFLRAFFLRTTPATRVGAVVLIGCSLTAIFCLFEIIPSSITSPYFNLVDIALFQKTSSSSYIERSSWTHAGIAAFWASHCIGVGVGSVRTSNWYANILASTGIVGVCLLLASFAQIVSPYRRYTERGMLQFSRGLKFSLIPGAVMIALAGTTPDPGAWMTSTLGLIYGLKLADSVGLRSQFGKRKRHRSFRFATTTAESNGAPQFKKVEWR